MSVVVEALTLIVPRSVLDASYPGGAAGYLTEIGARGARWTCSDAYLTAASFLSDAIEEPVEHLLDRGLVFEDDGISVDAVVVDELTGPTLPCKWIEWKRDRDPFSIAWLASEEPGELATPEGWKPARLARSDIRDEEHMFRLREEGGVETWLDTNTGKMLRFPADPAGNEIGPVMKAMRAALEDRGWPHTMHGPRVVRATFRSGFLQHELEIKVQEDAKLVRCRGLLPFFAPPREPRERHWIDAVLALLNDHEGVSYEAYQVDQRTGRLFSWFNVEITDGVISRKLAGEIIGEIEKLSDWAQQPLLAAASRWLDAE